MATQTLRFGGPIQVLLAAGSQELLQSLAAIVAVRPNTRVAGQFGSATDLLEWLVWTHKPWHYAFVDMALWTGQAQEWLRQLVARRDAGTVVALVDAVDDAARALCMRVGIEDLLQKGDLASFREYVEKRMM
jgi:hypothetical protein